MWLSQWQKLHVELSGGMQQSQTNENTLPSATAWNGDCQVLNMPGLAVQAMRLKHGLKFRMTSVALKMAGHKKVANMIISSWKVCHCPLHQYAVLSTEMNAAAVV